MSLENVHFLKMFHIDALFSFNLILRCYVEHHNIFFFLLKRSPVPLVLIENACIKKHTHLSLSHKPALSHTLQVFPKWLV